jgi:hypothetical protein
MKTPKKQAANTGKKDVHGPGDGTPVAARVFGNYVLVPVRQKPDEEITDSALHGAALLVFADKGQEQVKLRTGFPERVAGGSQSPAAGESEPGPDAGDRG